MTAYQRLQEANKRASLERKYEDVFKHTYRPGLQSTYLVSIAGLVFTIAVLWYWYVFFISTYLHLIEPYAQAIKLVYLAFSAIIVLWLTLRSIPKRIGKKKTEIDLQMREGLEDFWQGKNIQLNTELYQAVPGGKIFFKSGLLDVYKPDGTPYGYAGSLIVAQLEEGVGIAWAFETDNPNSRISVGRVHNEFGNGYMTTGQGLRGSFLDRDLKLSSARIGTIGGKEFPIHSYPLKYLVELIDKGKEAGAVLSKDNYFPPLDLTRPSVFDSVAVTLKKEEEERPAEVIEAIKEKKKERVQDPASRKETIKSKQVAFLAEKHPDIKIRSYDEGKVDEVFTVGIFKENDRCFVAWKMEEGHVMEIRDRSYREPRHLESSSDSYGVLDVGVLPERYSILFYLDGHVKKNKYLTQKEFDPRTYEEWLADEEAEREEKEAIKAIIQQVKSKGKLRRIEDEVRRTSGLDEHAIDSIFKTLDEQMQKTDLLGSMGAGGDGQG